MTAEKLIHLLQKYHPDSEVSIEVSEFWNYDRCLLIDDVYGEPTEIIL